MLDAGDTGGDADDLVVGVKQWMAQRYVKDLSKITIRGQVTHSESGSRCGGTPPYGYDYVYYDSTGRPYQHVRWLETGDKEVYGLDGKLTRIVPRGERLSASRRRRRGEALSAADYRVTGADVDVTGDDER